jgi:hypothetical protein
MHPVQRGAHFDKQESSALVFDLASGKQVFERLAGGERSCAIMYGGRRHEALEALLERKALARFSEERPLEPNQRVRRLANGRFRGVGASRSIIDDIGREVPADAPIVVFPHQSDQAAHAESNDRKVRIANNQQ